MKPIALLLSAFLIVSCTSVKKQTTNHNYSDQHRPQIHFSPKIGWMNDPNGMVYHNGTYHLFFQHYPDGTKWGPMHWGHATSKDLVHWQEHKIALYPDNLGTIFSGSAVIDKDNTAGFGKNAMVAIFTHHNTELEKTGSDKYQYQSLAYSLDEGKTWTKYSGNPVLPNPGIRDFRDPKVFWYEAEKKWVMTLATLDHITFYSSPDLKNWKEESKFGKTIGAHGGVWECPDLFPLIYNGQKHWVLIVNINPGGPNGGSATQYFVGNFDGKTFKPYQTDTQWLDYGPDEYAGVTWDNTGDRRLFIGWMSNWQYANDVPTQLWRSAMTISRELGIEKIGNKYFVTSKPVKELNVLNGKEYKTNSVSTQQFNLSEKAGALNSPVRLNISSNQIGSFDITLSNDLNEKVIIGFNAKENQYFIDRSKSGKTDFEKGFAAKHISPRFSFKNEMDLTLIIDDASVELFADRGLTVMTSIFFPTKNYTNVSINTNDGFVVKSLVYNKLNKIWR